MELLVYRGSNIDACIMTYRMPQLAAKGLLTYYSIYWIIACAMEAYT